MTNLIHKSLRDAGLILLPGIILGLLAVVLTSCVTDTTQVQLPDNPVPAVVPNTLTHNTVRGVFCGLTMTNPDGANPCPGADVDAMFLADDAKAAGVNAIVLLNDDCTWRSIKERTMMHAEGLGVGDMLVVTLSGHGTQFKDKNGDEADGMDEALCLFMDLPGPTVDYIIDDRVMTELLEPLWAAHPGLDIFMITDTCHSEGNFRALWRWITQEPASRNLVGQTPRGIDGALVQLAMCREDSYSYGNYSGGTGTQALLRVRKGNIGRLGAFVGMQTYMNLSIQQPTWVEFNSVSPLLRNGEFWK